MAYVNVAEWKTNQVCEWLKGLENSILPYIHSFMNHNVNGQQLLNLRPEDLEHLGVLKLGHQEIILEAVEYLRNFHYELDRENLQLLAMRLSCQTLSLHNELVRQNDSQPVTTQTLSDVVAIITVVKPLIRWLDQQPFSGQQTYNDKKIELLKLSLEMATCAQRDRFAEKPIEEIRTTCKQMAKLADNIIQDIADPLLLQPSSLDLATLKKRPGDDLGFCVLPSFHGAHQITEIKFGSVAHQCGKIEESDEIVQVNYQTVVGWERKNVLELFRENPAESLLTLKKRPRHMKIYGQIYIKPYRLPSNKKTPYATRWQNNLPSPRPELLTIPDFTMPLPRHVPKISIPEPISILDTVSIFDTMMTDDDNSDSDIEIETSSSVRFYSVRPRNLIQRRATITCASSTIKHNFDIEQFWKELKEKHSTIFKLHDKAVSCAHGLNNVQKVPVNLRSQTCLHFQQHSCKKRVATISNSRAVQFQNNNLCDDRFTYNNRRDHITVNTINGINVKYPEIPNSENKNNAQLQTSCKIIVDAQSDNKNSDNTVPFKESVYQSKCSNYTDDNKEHSRTVIQELNNKKHETFDKSHSTPSNNFTELNDDFIDKKFEIALDRQYKQERMRNTNLVNNNNSNLNESELPRFDFTEELEEHKQTYMQNCTINDRKVDFLNTQIIGNVAQKITDIEKTINNKSIESTEKITSKISSVCDAIKTRFYIKVDDIDIDFNDNVHEFKVDSCNITADFYTDEENNGFVKMLSMPKSGYFIKSVNNQFIESKREINEDTFGPLNSNNEKRGTNCKSNSEITIKKFTNIDDTLQEHTESIVQIAKVKENKDHNIKQFIEEISEKYSDFHKDSNQNEKMIKALSPNVHHYKNAVVGNISMKYPTPISNNISHPIHSESLKQVISGKSKVKIKLMPPIPPPRKYITKSTMNVDITQHQQQMININLQNNHQQQQPTKPKIPERSKVCQNLKKIDVAREIISIKEENLPEHHRSEHFKTDSNFINEPTFSQEIKVTCLLDDSFGYTQIAEANSIDESKLHVSICSQPQDFSDDSCSLHQSDNKRIFEKDRSHERGMVNRAMTVAKSIGLHSTLIKSSSSPKNIRKQNTNLTKRRNVSVKDITPGDLEGWLTYRSRGAGGAWARAWFIMKDTSLYRFKSQNSNKANCLIVLSGFTASQAAEVKSRKYAFKVYHTGTVFYFAADTDDTFIMWLDAINRATFGADQTSGLFSETDESDIENKIKVKCLSIESKPVIEKAFRSLKKLNKKDSIMKDHEMSGSSLDRKYLKFLGTRTQNVPVPTAQFRSYRRVLPTTPNSKLEKLSTPDLQITIAGSTFYGLSTSHSTNDVLKSSLKMSDYRQTTDRSQISHTYQHSDEFQGFITLEEFMLSRREEESVHTINNNNNKSAQFTFLDIGHRHLQDQNIANGSPITNMVQNNHMIYGFPNNEDNILLSPRRLGNPTSIEACTSSRPFDNEANIHSVRNESMKSKIHKNSLKSSYTQFKNPSNNNHYEGHQPYLHILNNEDLKNNRMNTVNNSEIQFSTLDYGERLKPQSWSKIIEGDNTNKDLQNTKKKLLKNISHSNSSGDLTCHACSETIQYSKKKSSIARNGSFNMADQRRHNHIHSERNWIELLHSADKKGFNINNSQLKRGVQYHSPPILLPTFKKDSIKVAYETQLDKGTAQKKNKGLRNLFGNKNLQKSSSLNLSYEPQKTLLGSPKLHRTLFHDKSSHQYQYSCSDTENPKTSRIMQCLCSYNRDNQYRIFNQDNNSVNLANEWNSNTIPHTPTCIMSGVTLYQKRLNTRHHMSPPIFPYIPPPTSPPPDYPGLEYPPVFEPGTYSLSDASLLHYRSTKNNQNYSD